MEEYILSVNGISGKQNEFTLKNITFQLPYGYICAIVGNNGAGKSTLLNYIVDENAKYTGDISVCGMNVKSKHAQVMELVGFVSEGNSFFDALTARENASILGAFYKEFDMDLFRQYMEKMNAPQNLNYYRMSRGEKIKFQIAFAIAHKSKLFIMDEITAGMSPVFRKEYFSILSELISDGTASVLMTSQILSEIKEKTDYVGIMDEGRLVNFGESLDVIPKMRGVYY